MNLYLESGLVDKMYEDTIARLSQQMSKENINEIICNCQFIGFWQLAKLINFPL